jgi:hypothetical protein
MLLQEMHALTRTQDLLCRSQALCHHATPLGFGVSAFIKQIFFNHKYFWIKKSNVLLGFFNIFLINMLKPSKYIYISNLNLKTLLNAG